MRHMSEPAANTPALTLKIFGTGAYVMKRLADRRWSRSKYTRIRFIYPT
jgi:hypothetical protein